jgi:hypothetical protein
MRKPKQDFEDKKCEAPGCGLFFNLKPRETPAAFIARKGCSPECSKIIGSITRKKINEEKQAKKLEEAKAKESKTKKGNPEEFEEKMVLPSPLLLAAVVLPTCTVFKPGDPGFDELAALYSADSFGKKKSDFNILPKNPKNSESEEEEENSGIEDMGED